MLRLLDAILEGAPWFLCMNNSHTLANGNKIRRAMAVDPTANSPVHRAIMAEANDTPENMTVISERAERSMSLSVQLREGDVLPEEDRRGPIGVVDRTLEKALATRLDQPFWFDTTRYPAYVDIRVQQPQGVLRIIAPRERAVATQAHIFVLWLTIATVLLIVAVIFVGVFVDANRASDVVAYGVGAGALVTGLAIFAYATRKPSTGPKAPKQSL